MMKRCSCWKACHHCFDACLQEEDVEMMAQCIRLDRECADICAQTLQVLTRNSPFSKPYLLLCAEACQACAKACRAVA